MGDDVKSLWLKAMTAQPKTSIFYYDPNVSAIGMFSYGNPLPPRKKVSEVIINEPKSYWKKLEDYEKEARGKVARTYRSWPQCGKCKQDKFFVTTTSIQGIDEVVTVSLECCEYEVSP
jgi:DNA-directed RNA polymerase subunit M/transcription elongation factor TFIIS